MKYLCLPSLSFFCTGMKTQLRKELVDTVQRQVMGMSITTKAHQSEGTSGRKKLAEDTPLIKEPRLMEGQQVQRNLSLSFFLIPNLE